MNDYLTKPIDPGKLRILLREARDAESRRLESSGAVGDAMELSRWN
jgi:hypothetical protein